MGNVEKASNIWFWIGRRYFNKVFIKNYDEKSEVGNILEVDVKYPKELYKLHGDLPFLPERKLLPKSLLLTSKINVTMLFA